MSIVSDLDAAMLQPARSVPAARRLGSGVVRTDDSGRPLRAVRIRLGGFGEIGLAPLDERLRALVPAEVG